MLKFLLLPVLLASVGPLLCQKAMVKGHTADSSDRVKVEGAVAIILRARDSMLVTFRRSNKEGNFEMSNINPGQYILLVMNPLYVDYVELFSVDSGQAVVSIKKILLISKAKMLPEVVVRTNLAIRLKGDTTEYKADSFKVQANASVEDLLKQLPGIQIDQNGKISVRGRIVNKVLVSCQVKMVG